MKLADGVEKSSAFVVFKNSATTASPHPTPQHLIYTSGACIITFRTRVCVFAPAPYLPEK